MTGETDLSVLLDTMEPTLKDGVFVFATLAPDSDIPTEANMVFRETEGLTVILPQAAADAAGVSYIFPSRMITLKVHSSLEAVGLIAAVATALADAGISTNPVSGYFHDHLFVPAEKAQAALIVLKALSDRG